jgi:hypothetical protein
MNDAASGLVEDADPLRLRDHDDKFDQESETIQPGGSEATQESQVLKRNDSKLNRCFASASCLRMIFS